MSKYRNGGRVELDVERFPHEKKQNRTFMFWLIFIRALFSDFMEGFARITFTLNEHSPVKITLLKVPQNVECHTHIGTVGSTLNRSCPASRQVSATFAKQFSVILQC